MPKSINIPEIQRICQIVHRPKHQGIQRGKNY